MPAPQPLDPVRIGDLTVSFETISAEAAFRRRVGRPVESDIVAYGKWLLKHIPKGDPRSVAAYLHAEFGGQCGICGTMVDIGLRHPHPASAQVDHVVPRAFDGADVWGNVRLAHRQCNMERNSGEIGPVEAGALLAEAVHLIDHPEARIPRDIHRLREAQSELPSEIDAAQRAFDEACRRNAHPAETGPLRLAVQNLVFKRDSYYPREIARLSAEQKRQNRGA